MAGSLRYSVVFYTTVVLLPLLGHCSEKKECAQSNGSAIVREIRPSQTDRQIKRFDSPHWVIVDSCTDAKSPLVIFLPGTRGQPANAAALLRIVAGQGYRVIGLDYENAPAANRVCDLDAAEDCYDKFRGARTFGSDPATASDSADSILSRLIRLLEYLDREYPEEGWRGYLSHGAPSWDRIVVSGFSQGAGMAAYIAKKQRVSRVVLFSSPWDSQPISGEPARWLSGRSATPAERWFAEYHLREETARKIARAYAALNIPKNHICIFDRDLPTDGQVLESENPYHVSTITLRAYEPQWRYLFGRSPGR